MEIFNSCESFYTNNIIFRTAPDIRDIAKCLLSINVTYFSYDRRYSDGSHFRLLSAPEWAEYYYRNHLYQLSIFEKDARLFQDGYVFWSWLNKNPIYTAAEEHDIAHGITIIQRYDNYLDTFHFGTKRENYISPEIFISNLHCLYQFISLFKQKAKKIILQAQNSRLILPAVNNEICSSDLHDFSDKQEAVLTLNQVSRIYLGEKFDNAYLTRREIDIICLLKKGMTSELIASHLKTSKRTIEVQIKHIKEKFNCDTLFELGFLLGSLGTKNIYPFLIK